jgi:hypothetical protein
MRLTKVILWTVGEVAISVIGGFLIPLGLFLLLLFISGLDWEVPLVNRNPFAWILFWPDPIWKQLVSEDLAETASYITTITTFSIATFVIPRLLNRRRRLS